ncbi:MAG: MFS transporter [Anaerolineaceae bacterium]|nr:MAG: MFS transporter [Anaerolineaceae bacterium]
MNIFGFLILDKALSKTKPENHQAGHFSPHSHNSARKITWSLFLAQALGSAGFLAVATVSSIVGRALIGSDALATVPEAVYHIGVSLAALGWGYGMDRLGRRRGLSLGLSLGVVGALVVVASIMQSSLILLLIGLSLMGIARSALQLARFAAAEVHPAHERARAISNVVLGGAAATFLWAGISRQLDWLSQMVHAPELALPYVISGVFFFTAAALIHLFLRPDPRDLGIEIARHESTQQAIEHSHVPARTLKEIFQQPAVRVAANAMIFGQAVMVMIMIITPLHMRHHTHTIADISLVISAHVFGMYAFSILSGRLADRFGRGFVIIIGAITLIAACLTAPFSPESLPLGFSLFSLGLGWNFCYVGGSSLLADQLSPAERSRTQGFNDLLIGLVSAAGSLGSGIIFAAVGFGTMSIIGAVTAAIPLVMTVWWMTSKANPIRTAITTDSPTKTI